MAASYWDVLIKRSKELLTSQGKEDAVFVIENGVYSIEMNPFHHIEGGVGFVSVVFKMPKSLYKSVAASKKEICRVILDTLLSLQSDDRALQIIAVKIKSED